MELTFTNDLIYLGDIGDYETDFIRCDCYKTKLQKVVSTTHSIENCTVVDKKAWNDYIAHADEAFARLEALWITV